MRKLSTVPKAMWPAFAASRAPDMWSRIQAILVDEKYGSSRSPVLRRDFRFRIVAIQFTAAVGGAAVLPHDGIEQRHAGASIPENGGFALIGDANGGDADVRPRPTCEAAGA